MKEIRTYLVELLDGHLEPPVGPHEGDGDRDLGVHGAEGPVLPEEEDGRLVERHAHRHQDHQLQEEAEHQRDETHQEDHRHAGLQSLQGKP